MTQSFQYDADYFYNMLRMYSPTAKQICDARWAFVAQAGAKTVLDYGSGCGFFKAFAPADVAVDTFDLMKVPQTGVRAYKYDLVTLWDVLEHIPDLESMRKIFDMTNWIGLTVPIKPADVPWKEYKHFKPGEHIHHFQEDYLCAVMDLFGFELVKSGNPECPPRSMIGSFLFKRRAA
jgi:hypothetical protein